MFKFWEKNEPVKRQELIENARVVRLWIDQYCLFKSTNTKTKEWFDAFLNFSIELENTCPWTKGVRCEFELIGASLLVKEI
jgi:hypothetical protein